MIEAMALGKPIVSPSLIHFPEKNKINKLGVLTPFVNNETMLRVFIDKLVYIIENLDAFNSMDIRSLAYKYYSWSSFVEEFDKTSCSI